MTSTPAQMGVTLTTPEILEVLDNTGTWVPVGQIESGAFVPIGVPEAPTDGGQYGRQNASWTIITGGGGGGVSAVFDSVSTIAATNIPSSIHNINALSYSAPGDLQGRPMNFAKVAGPDYTIFNANNMTGSTPSLTTNSQTRYVLTSQVPSPIAAGPYYVRLKLAITAGARAVTIGSCYVGMSANQPTTGVPIVTFTQTGTNNFANNDYLIIGNNIYYFLNSLSGLTVTSYGSAGCVLIGANFAASAANLAQAINGGINPAAPEAGTTYIPTAAIPDVTVTLTGGSPYVITFKAIIPGLISANLMSQFFGPSAGAFSHKYFTIPTGTDSSFDGSQVPMTFNGGSLTVGPLSGAQTIVSDLVAYAYTPGAQLVVSVFWTGTAITLANAAPGHPVPRAASQMNLYLGQPTTLANTGANDLFSAVDQEGPFLNDYYGCLSVEVVPTNYGSLDYTKLGFVQSADSAWWGLTNQDVTPRMFGSLQIGNAANDDYPALSAALRYAAFFASGYNGGTLRIPVGSYYCSQTLHATNMVRIVGDGLSIYLQSSTKIQFPHAVTGIVVTPFGVNVNNQGAGYVEGLDLFGILDDDGSIGGVTGQTVAHGIASGCPIVLNKVNTVNFSGDGVCLFGFTGVGATDGSLINHCIAAANGRNGFYQTGTDANSITYIACTSSGNKRVGFLDDSQASSTYIGCTTEPNGDSGGSHNHLSGVVSHGGINYALCPNGQVPHYSPQGGLFTPGAGDTYYASATPIWTPVRNADPATAAWVPGGYYTPTGPFMSSASGFATWIGCYADGTNGMMFTAGGLILGGQLACTFPYQFNTVYNGISIEQEPINYPGANTSNSDSSLTICEGLPDFTLKQISRYISSFNATTDLFNNWFETLKPINGDYQFGPDTTNHSYVITGQNTTWQFGSSAIQPYIFSTPKMALSTTGDGIVISYGTAAPTTGAHGQGSIVFNTSAAASGFVGWVCTTAGTPGTWKTFGVISP